MAPRAFGALFALVAALAFAMAFAGGLVPTTIPGWWDGHPTVQGKELERKSIHVGLLEADGCNHGDEVRCEVVPTGHTLDIVGIAELAALGLGIVTALMAALSMWKMGDRRKFLGKLLLFEVLLIGGGAAAIFFHGPDLKFPMQIGIPVGLGLYAVMGGSVLALLGSIIAMRLEPEPLRLKTSDQRIQQPHQSQPAFDVRELLRDNQQGMRVSQPHMMPPGPGGPLPGPQGPLGAPMGPAPQHHPMNPAPGHQPLFETAPHLRPLYDMQNAGAAPSPLPPQMPTRAPTPVSRRAMGDMLGIAMPPPVEAPTSATRRPSDFHPGDSASLHAPIAPYSPSRSIEQTADLEQPSHSMLDPDPFEEQPPSKSRPRAPQFNESPTTPRPPANAARAAAAVPRPARPSAPPRVAASKHPTLAVAVPPMPPTTPSMPPPMPMRPVVDAEPPEPRTSVEVDAEAKARSRAAKSAQPERPSDLAMTMPVDRHSASAFDHATFDHAVDHTDESVIAPPLARADHATDEIPFASDASPATEPVGESFEELQTRDANKFTAHELGMAATEVGPRAVLAPRAGTQPRGSAPRAQSEGPTSRAKRQTVDDPALPFGSAASPGQARLVVDSALSFGSAASPGQARLVVDDNDDEATAFGTRPREAKDTHIKPTVIEASTEYGDQLAEPPTFATTSTQIAAARAPSDGEVSTAFARHTNDEPGGAKPSEAAPAPDDREVPTGFKRPPPSASRPPPRPTATTKPPAAPRTPLPPLTAHKPDDVSPFPVAPRTGTFEPPKPLPRMTRPSVPPPASKIPSFGSKLPSIVPSNGIGKPPSNLEPSQSTNKASTTSTPSPFATIPSPFGPKSPVHEAVTRPARQNATPAPPTASARPEQGEAPTAPPQRPSETPTRAAGNGDHETPTRAAGASNNVSGSRPRWRPATEAPTSHTTANEFLDATERDRKLVAARGAGRDDLLQDASGEISPRPRTTSESTRPRSSADASTPSTRSSGLHEAATVSARDHELPKTTLPTGPRSTQQRATAPPISTAPSSLPPPKKAAAASSGPTPACPQCEAPMAWVEEHLRFYCASCRMYF